VAVTAAVMIDFGVVTAAVIRVFSAPITTVVIFDFNSWAAPTDVWMCRDLVWNGP
jgi:hypothetical protein